MDASSASAPLYITTPIYYVNAAPHIGHAYTSIACDAACRFAKLDGTEAKLVTGTDEHGQKVEESAASQGCEPLEFATQVSGTFRDLAESYAVDYDRFIRTTEPEHALAVEKLWRQLGSSIYLGTYEGWYCVRDECYYAENELVDGKAPTGAEVEWRAKEPSYFFKLSEYREILVDLYESDKVQILPVSRKNEVLSFLKNNLTDLSISRTTFDWGVRVPDDPDHVVYVWIDALTNYLTALGWPDDPDWETWWAGSTHVVGKDILRFHAVYWPAILVAAGLPPPSKIVAHGWWTKDGQKISKSLGNVVDPNDLLDTYGLDASRYFMLSEVPFGKDGDFSDRELLAAANGYLANAVGNLAQRICTMLFKHEDGLTPENDYDEEAENLIEMARALPDAMRPLVLEDFRFDLALLQVEEVVRAANRYFDSMAPWNLKKTDTDKMVRVLAASLEVLRCVAIAYQPFMPTASKKLLDQILVPDDQRSFECIRSAAIVPGLKLSKPQPVFPRVELSTESESSGDNKKSKKNAAASNKKVSSSR